MYEDLPNEVEAFNFDEFANHLLDQGVQASPSQLHGCLSGLHAAGAPAEPEYGLDALTQALELRLHGDLANHIMQLYTATETALQDEEFTFFPLLPDDDEDIALRTIALANWCDGFLAGFAYQTAGKEVTGGAFSQECGEALRDIAALAQAEVTADEDDDDAEDSYMELVEYLRVAVVNVFMDSVATSVEREYSSNPRGPLH